MSGLSSGPGQSGRREVIILTGREFHFYQDEKSSEWGWTVAMVIQFNTRGTVCFKVVTLVSFMFQCVFATIKKV